MTDLVVTVPKHFWFDWIAEGDAAGAPPSGQEWGFFLGRNRPPIEPGDRLYVVAWGRLRGYAPVTRVVQHEGRWIICREAGAVACTVRNIGMSFNGFQGFRKRWWDREDEVDFPDWMMVALPMREIEKAAERGVLRLIPRFEEFQ